MATPASFPAHPTSHRLASIDALRGLIMLLMLVDHSREFFFLHQQVSDPMSLDSTPPALFFTRFCSHFCAPLFVFLTGLGAWLYGQQPERGPRATATYLARRGLLLIVLELTLVSFAWSFQLLPSMFYLQVIWVIGLSMLALAALLWLPRPYRLCLALLLLGGHNALDHLHFAPDDSAFIPWAILHERQVISLGTGLQIRTSYPLLPWIGVILLGHALGPWFAASVPAASRRLRLAATGLVALLGFVLLRLADSYGDHPWHAGADGLHTLMAFLNLTKYPPSLLFCLLTLGTGLLLLAALEQRRPWAVLRHIGSEPLFFYLAHLYLLHLLYLLLLAVCGPTQGSRYGFTAVWQLWAVPLLLLPLLHRACLYFAAAKRRHPGSLLRLF